MKDNYVPAEINKEGFTCFDCGAFSKHDWNLAGVNKETGHIFSGATGGSYYELKSCRCQKCGFISYWLDGKLIFPLNSNVELPLEEMPDEIKSLYNEARDVLPLSPKSSCALLRLALQILCNDINGSDRKTKLSVTIPELLKKGLPLKISQMMDIIRVVGNDAVHPGEIKVDDNEQIAYSLFKIVNIIVEKLIVEPKEIDELYNCLPQNKKEEIEKRNDKILNSKDND